MGEEGTDRAPTECPQEREYNSIYAASELSWEFAWQDDSDPSSCDIRIQVERRTDIQSSTAREGEESR
jgi:hypothetical protein